MTQHLQALMLAAGRSQRFGSDKRFHKLQDGTPIISRALYNLQAAVDSVVLVVAAGETQLFSKLLVANKTPNIVEVAHAGVGMGASLACGINHIDGDAVLITLADMPFIQPTTIEQVAKALREYPLVVPSYRGKQGHPVGFQRRFFAELAELCADEGGKQIVQRHRENVKQFDVEDPGIVMDIDTSVDLMVHG
ncbi:MAG: nucleotidyltransferase family protein [Pseudomonadales bacterium]